MNVASLRALNAYVTVSIDNNVVWTSPPGGDTTDPQWNLSPPFIL
jgi:hypothetical protein